MQCGFDLGAAGLCKAETFAPYSCVKHIDQKCISCGSRATRFCSHNGASFDCGSPLCPDCEHGEGVHRRTSVPTRADVEQLKRNWLADPCYDLYSVEGFEPFNQELTEFQETQRAIWKQERKERLEARAAELGCTVALVELIERLERQIEDLSQRP